MKLQAQISEEIKMAQARRGKRIEQLIQDKNSREIR
jgi:hypothetical protein